MLKLIKEIFSKSSGDKEILAVVRSRSFLSSSMILIGILYFCFLWTYPLIDRDEGFHVGAAAEMMRKGEWVVPTLNDELFLHKPGMLYWTMIPSLKLFGNNEMAARIPSAAAMFIMLFFFYNILTRITGNREFSVTSTLVMAFTPIYFVVARTALTDGLLLLFITISLLSFFVAMEEEKGPDRKWYMLFWVGFAMGFLTKGPVAPAVILPTLFFYCLFQKKVWHVLKRSNIPVGIIIFIVVNIWFILIIERLGQLYIDKFFIGQIFKRGTKVLVSRGGGPLYYIAVFIIAGLPFSALFLPTCCTPFRMKYKERNDDAVKKIAYFSAIAAIATYIVFSCAKTKLPHYVLPAFPWLSILTVFVIYRLSKGESYGKWATKTISFLITTIPLLATIAVLAFPIAIPFILKFALKIMKPDSGEYAFPMTVPMAAYFVFPIALITLFLMIYPKRFLKQKAPYKALYSMILGAAVLCITGILVATIALNYLTLPAKQMCVDIKNRAGTNSKIIAYGLWKQSMSYYCERHMIRYKYKHHGQRYEKSNNYYKEPAPLYNIKDELKLNQPVYVMTRTRIKHDLNKIPNFVEIKQYDGYFLGGNQAAKKEFQSRQKN